MNYLQALDSIKKGRIASCYLLYGEETYYTHQIEQAIINAVLPPEAIDMGLQVFSQDPPLQKLIQVIETIPFMGGKNVIIVRDTKLFRSGKSQETDESNAEKLISCLAGMPEYSLMIFTTREKADKRRKLFKTVEQSGAVVELAPLKPRDARVWIQQRLEELHKTITNDALEYLMTGISFMPQISLGILDNEIQKLAIFAGAQHRITRDHLTVLSGVTEVSVFAMIDALSQKNVKVALKLLTEQLTAGEAPLKLIALLARQTRMLLQAKELSDKGYGGRDIAESLAVAPFVGEKLMNQARRFSVDKLKQTLLHLAQTDQDIKSGQATNIELETIFVNLCQTD